MRNAADAKGICKRSVPINVNFIYRNHFTFFFSNFFKHGLNFFAGGAPVRVKIKHQEMFSGCLDDFIKLFHAIYISNPGTGKRISSLSAGILTAGCDPKNNYYDNNPGEKPQPPGS